MNPFFKLKESETLELKKSTAQLKPAVISIVAMLSKYQEGYTGDLFYLIGEAEKYILKNIHIGMRLEGLKRIDVPEISKEAIREAIINAFCTGTTMNMIL
ncbi:hypothetical protein RSJ42_03415 [Methanosarcina hadiensis]|uniref:hypothetical protein n=1 Tax=Methanosarcina hadiensis TaxID=3078083 RepID=UPI0039775E38